MRSKNSKIRVFATCLALGVAAVGAAIPKTVTFTSFIAGTASLPLNKPVYFSEIPGKPGYYVVLEQHLGRVSVFNKVAGNWVKTAMDSVVIPTAVSGNNEMGLLGMAFHPNFVQNHKYYLYYNPSYSASAGSRAWVVERQTDSTLVKRNASVASRTLLIVASHYTNHKAGTIDFGPLDGYLYIAVGDGGGSSTYRYGNDSANGAQNPDSLLGKILRIDVDGPDAFPSDTTRNYAIPADNPFVGGGHKEEIFALGLRNPFKWSFDVDPGTGKANLWLGHVGQDSAEAATLVPKGANLGWRSIESGNCNVFYSATCSTAGVTLPFLTYRHLGVDSVSGKCIIGGYVYRGNPASPYYGIYFFGDSENNHVWAVKTDGATTQERVLMPPPVGWPSTSTTEQLTSFGRDLSGNLYAVIRGTNSTGATNGTIYALGGPDLVATTAIPRRTGKAFAPAGLRDLKGLQLRDLQGKKVSGAPGDGLYFTRRPGDKLPSLVPVLK